jgi:hypothetical protein
MSYIITGAVRAGEYQTNYGTMVKYILSLEGEADGVEIGQKPDTPAPKAGDVLDGTIESTKYGKKFKKTPQATGGARSGYTPDPATQVSIQRQIALGRAVDAVNNYNIQKGTDMKSVTINQYADQIIATADRFAAWLNKPALAEAKVELGSKEPAPLPTDENGNINLDDIPFNG